MQTIDDLLSDTLFQYIDKEDIDPQNELSNEDWQGFLNQYASTFASEASELANSLLDEYKLNWLESKFDRKVNDEWINYASTEKTYKRYCYAIARCYWWR